MKLLMEKKIFVIDIIMIEDFYQFDLLEDVFVDSGKKDS